MTDTQHNLLCTLTRDWHTAAKAGRSAEAAAIGARMMAIRNGDEPDDDDDFRDPEPQEPEAGDWTPRREQRITSRTGEGLAMFLPTGR